MTVHESNISLNGDFSFFPSIGLKLSAACRFNCPFCCEPIRSQPIASLENYISILNQIAEAGTKRVCFTGGEPLLYPQLTEILEHSKRAGLFNLLLTADGHLLSKSYERILPHIDAIRFSVHGLNGDHDKVVGSKRAFDEIEKAIDLLIKHNVDVYVTTVATKATLPKLGNIVDWCIKHGVKKYFIFGLMRSGNGNDYIQKNGEMATESIDRIIKELASSDYAKNIDIIYYSYKEYAECILIYGDGNVVIDPCPDSATHQLTIGNLFNESPESIVINFNKNPKNKEAYLKHLYKHMPQL